MSEPTTNERAQEILKQFSALTLSIACYLYMNSRNIGQFFLLSLRVGQLLAAVVIGVVYCTLIDKHRYHFCRYNPQIYQCRTYGREPKLYEVPWVYILVLFTVSAFYDLPF